MQVVLQQSDNDCGPSCALAVARTLRPGLEYSPPVAAEDGLGGEALVQWFQAHRFAADDRQLSAGDLHRLTATQRAILDYLSDDGVEHWVVFCGFWWPGVFLMDPLVGRRFAFRKAFDLRWSGYAVLIDGAFDDSEGQGVDGAGNAAQER